MSAHQHFSIVLFDVEASGSLSDPEKKKVSDDLYDLVHEALAESGIPGHAVREEDRGDGIFLLINAGVSKSLLFRPFLGLVDAKLAARRVDQALVRLRLVIHHGEVIVDDRTASGQAVDTAFVLLDSPELRDALRRSRGGRIALAVPNELYRSLVRGSDAPNPDAFSRRLLNTKYGAFEMWVTVTGVTEQPGAGPRTPDSTPKSSAGPSMVNQFGDKYDVGMNHGVVGGHHSGTINFGQGPADRGGN